MSTQNDTPWWDPDVQQPQQEAADPETPSASDPISGSNPRRLTTFDQILDWINSNLHTNLYMLVGFLIACSILGFGFWRTLLVACCVGAGYLIGGWRDGNPRLRKRIQHFREHWLDDNPFMNDRH